MGKQKANTKRKQTLQLKETKKTHTGSSGKFISTLEYTSGGSAPVAAAAAAAGAPTGQDSTSMDPKLANFLEGMNSLSDEPSNPSPAAAPVANGESTSVATTAVAQPTQPPPATVAPITFWQAIVDPNTNHTYYWNPETNDVAWTLPPGGVIAAPEGAGKEKEEPGENVDELLENYPYVKKELPEIPEKPASLVEDSVEAGPTQEEATAVTASSTKMDEEKDSAPEQGGTKKKATPEREPLVRNLPAATDSQQPAKKPRVGSENSTPPRKKGPVTPSGGGGVSKQSEQMMRFKVSTLADQFTRKLEYLHVSVEKLTSFEVLSIQLQTRLTDWKEGGLPTKYMLSKLKLMNKELSECEATAAPEGYEYIWDSLTCRYHFKNTATGELSLEPPLSPADLTDKEEAVQDEMEVEPVQDETESLDELASADEQEEVPVAPITHPQTVEEVMVPAPAAISEVHPVPEPPLQDVSPARAIPSVSPVVQPPAHGSPLSDQLDESGQYFPLRKERQVSEEREEVEVVIEEGSSEKKELYYGPTADYLGSLKVEEKTVVLPPPRYNKKAQALQRQHEERERLARIERESRPITVHGVREKLRPKLPYWKQKQLESSLDRDTGAAEEPKPSPPPRPVATPTISMTAREDLELICEYPPGGADPPTVNKARGGEHVPKGSSRVTSDPSTMSLQSGISPTEPPSHHMQTGELVFSSDPVVAKQQKELYSHSKLQSSGETGSAEGSDTVGGVAAAFKAPELEKKMRENIIRRGGVYSFKIGSGGKSDSAPHKAEEDQRQSAGDVTAMSGWQGGEEGEAVGVEVRGDTAARPDEPVAECTGEAEQEMQVPPAEDSHPPAVVDPLPAFQAPSEGRIEPETGILEEPGEVLGDFTAGPGDVAMAADSGGDAEQGSEEPEQDLEEGEMVGEEGEASEGEIEDDGPLEVTVGGKCYMDLEKGGVADSDHGYRKKIRSVGEKSGDQSPPDYKSRKSRHSRTPESYKYKSSKKKPHRHHDSDSDYDRYSDGGYKRKRRSSHYTSSSSSKRHRDFYKDDSDYSDDYYHSSKKRRSGRDRSYSPDGYSRDRYGSKSSRRSGKSSHYSSRNRSRSRSHSYDSDHDRKKSSSVSSKHKKKEKRKKRKRSTSRSRGDGSGDDKASKPAPNVLVGKVGKISTVRPLGQEKKVDESEQAKAVDPAMSGFAMHNVGDPQQMSAAYYQQPSTGQVPYYSAYPGYQYPYTQESYAVQEPQQVSEQPAQPEWQWGGTDPVEWAAAKAAAAAAEQEAGSEATGQEVGVAGESQEVGVVAGSGPEGTGQGVGMADESCPGEEVGVAGESGRQEVGVADGSSSEMTGLEVGVPDESQQPPMPDTEGALHPPLPVTEPSSGEMDSSWSRQSPIPVPKEVPAPMEQAKKDHNQLPTSDSFLIEMPVADNLYHPSEPMVDVEEMVAGAGSGGGVGVASGSGSTETTRKGSSGQDVNMTGVCGSGVGERQAAAQVQGSGIGIARPALVEPETLPCPPTEEAPALPPLPPPPDAVSPQKPPPDAVLPQKPPPDAVPPQKPPPDAVPPQKPPPDAILPQKPPPDAVPPQKPPPDAVPPQKPPPDAVPPQKPPPDAVPPQKPPPDAVPPQKPPPDAVPPQKPPPDAVLPQKPPPEAVPPQKPPNEEPTLDEVLTGEPGIPLTEDSSSETLYNVETGVATIQVTGEEIEECEMDIEDSDSPEKGGTTVGDSEAPLPTAEPTAQPPDPVPGVPMEAGTTHSSPAPTADVTPPMAAPVPPPGGAEAGSGVAISSPAAYYPQTTSAYNYAAYNQQAYNYAYAQNYSYAQQAAYMQQAAYGAAYGMPTQYYQGMYAYPATSAAPYYGTGYSQTPSQIPVQNIAETPASTSDSKKKGDFSLPGSKEKQMKSMMDKWKSFKEDI